MILAAYGLSKHFPVRGAFRSRTTLKAVDDADLKIDNEQIVGLVGESGSGKSTLGRCLIRLMEPTSGEVLFDIPNERLALYENLRAKSREIARKANNGSEPPEDDSQSKRDMARVLSEHSLLQRSGGELRQLRRHMNIVFQDPYSSLNPRLKLSEIIAEPMVSTRFSTRSEARSRAQELLREVGLPGFFEDRYPHELSGGQRQRVAIARAISTKPKLLILDEPTSALDVSVQAQILNLLRQLREKYGISMLVITHNIAVVAYLAEKVYVMYAGKIMEWGDKRKVLREPEHPYTKALMSAVPIAGEQKIRTILRGDPPNLVEPPLACRFHPRCPVAFEICGWSADEVSDDLAYLLTGKYFTTFGDALDFRAVDENLVSIEGTSDVARVEQIVAQEKDEIRSMTSVEKITASEGKLLVRLRSRIDPELYLLPDGREVNCLLFRPLNEAGMAQATIRGQ